MRFETVAVTYAALYMQKTAAQQDARALWAQRFVRRGPCSALKTESERTTFRLTLNLTFWIGKVKTSGTLVPMISRSSDILHIHEYISEFMGHGHDM